MLLNGTNVTGAIAVVIALASTYQGACVTDGPKLSYCLFAELIHDIAQVSRGVPAILGVVDFRNYSSLRLLERFAFEELPHGAVSGTAGVFQVRLDQALARADEILVPN